MRKKWMNYLMISIIIFLVVFYSNKMSITEYVCYGIVFTLNFYEIIKNRF